MLRFGIGNSGRNVINRIVALLMHGFPFMNEGLSFELFAVDHNAWEDRVWSSIGIDGVHAGKH